MTQISDARREDVSVISGGARYQTLPTVTAECDGPVTRAYLAGATLEAKDIVFLNTSAVWVLADANSAATLSVGTLGVVVVGGSSGDTVTVALRGAVCKFAAASFTAGPYWLSETPGGGTTTKPTSGTSNAILAFFAPTTTTCHVEFMGFTVTGA